MTILQNCELWFAKLNKPSSRFNPENPTWELQIRTKDKNVKKQWEALSLPVKAIVPDDGLPYFRVNLSKKSLKKDGSPSVKVNLVDAKLRPLDPDTLGNGSIGNVRIFQREFIKKTGGKGVASIVMGVQVTRHVVYVPRVSEEFDALAGDTETIAPAGEDLVDSDF